MEIFLFIVSLILYGEYGEELETRYTARMLLYGYTTSLMVMVYVSSPFSLLISLGCLVASVGNIIITTTIRRIIPFLYVLGLLHVINFLSIYTHDYEMILSIPYYSDNSDLILRDLSLLIVGLCSSTIFKDTWLNAAIFILFLASHLYRFI